MTHGNNLHVKSHEMMPEKYVSIFLALILASGCSFAGGDNRNNEDQEDHSLEHTTNGNVISAEVPSAAGNIVWNSEFSGALQAVPGGISVVSDDGVVTLDGRSGEELWRYRDAGKELNIRFSEDGGVGVAETVVRDQDGERAVRGEFLDAESGEIIETLNIHPEDEEDEPPQYGSTFTNFGESIYLQRQHDKFQAYSLSSGEESWQSPQPFSCDVHGGLSVYFTDPIISNGLVISGFTCAEETGAEHVVTGEDGKRSSGVVAFDALDGSEEWRLEEDGAEDVFSPSSRVFLSSDSESVIQNRENANSQILDLDSGEQVFSHESPIVDFDSHAGQAVTRNDSEGVYNQISIDGSELGKADFSESCSSPADSEGEISLDEGILIACQGWDSFDEKLHWIEWDGNESETEVDIGVNYDDLTGMVAAPGSVVVAYTRDGESGGVIGLS